MLKCYTPWNIFGTAKATASVGHELTQMSLNSRINSLDMIYEFELTHHKECDLWVWFNSKFMWAWVITTNQLIRTTKIENNWCWLPDWVGYRRVLQPLAATLDAFQWQKDCFYGMILSKLIQLRHLVAQLQETSLVYCVIHWLQLCWMECTAGHMIVC